MEEDNSKQINKLNVKVATLTERVDKGFQFLNGQVADIKNNHLSHIEKKIENFRSDLSTLALKQTEAQGQRQAIDAKLALLISALTGAAVFLLNLLAKVFFNF